MIRGGWWNTGPGNARVANRSVHSPTHRIYYLGFRLLRTILFPFSKSGVPPVAKPRQRSTTVLVSALPQHRRDFLGLLGSVGGVFGEHSRDEISNIG